MHVCVFVFEAVLYGKTSCGLAFVNLTVCTLPFIGAALRVLYKLWQTTKWRWLLCCCSVVCQSVFPHVRVFWLFLKHTHVHARLPRENVGILLSLLIYIWITFILEFVFEKCPSFIKLPDIHRYLERSLPPGGRLRYIILRLSVLRQFGQIPSLNYLLVFDCFPSKYFSKCKFLVFFTYLLWISILYELWLKQIVPDVLESSSDILLNSLCCLCICRHWMMNLSLQEKIISGRTGLCLSGPISRSVTGWWAWIWTSTLKNSQQRPWTVSSSYIWTVTS